MRERGLGFKRFQPSHLHSRKEEGGRKAAKTSPNNFSLHVIRMNLVTWSLLAAGEDGIIVWVFFFFFNFGTWLPPTKLELCYYEKGKANIESTTSSLCPEAWHSHSLWGRIPLIPIVAEGSPVDQVGFSLPVPSLGHRLKWRTEGHIYHSFGRGGGTYKLATNMVAWLEYQKKMNPTMYILHFSYDTIWSVTV